MQVPDCKKGLISKRFKPSCFKIKILSSKKSSHVQIKFLLDQTLFVGAPNMPNCVASKFQRNENVGFVLNLPVYSGKKNIHVLISIQFKYKKNRPTLLYNNERYC